MLSKKAFIKKEFIKKFFITIHFLLYLKVRCFMELPISISFEKDLNSAQYEAVMHHEGPLLVIAGAGSGKTRTLVYRVARLVTSGIDPSNILLLTFTRKAAATMLERAAKIGGVACQKVQGGTFHAFCHRMLRSYCHICNYPPGFTIMDQSDAQDLIQLLAKQMELTGKGKKFPTKAALNSIFSKVANSGSSIEEILESNYPHMLEHAQGIHRLYVAYNDYKRAHALMDYDDLLINWLFVLRESEQIRKHISDRFKFIMIDEYQDTNLLQAEMIKLMACTHNNIMAVGDDSQSIYSFRGANFQNILDFPKLFPGTRIIKLEKNYRTTQPNLDCTNAIIANAKQKFTKHLTAHRAGGVPPTLLLSMDEDEQAQFVTSLIKKHLENGIEPQEIAVLFRAAFHSFQIETYLSRNNISFVKRGGMRLVDAAHIKDLICILRIMINPLDRLSLNRVLLLIDKLGPKSAEKIFEKLILSENPLITLAEFNSKATWAAEVRRLGKLLLSCSQKDFDLKDLLKELITWYRPYLEAKYFDDYPKRLQELEQLKAMAPNYTDAIEFLSDLALDPPEKDANTPEKDRIVLSTIHSAKGLEWKVVFLISLCEGRFPSSISFNRPDEIEEERRLFYVAATRAKDYLYFSTTAFINVQGAGLMPAKPSRFLTEIPEKLLKIEKFQKNISKTSSYATKSAKLKQSKTRQKESKEFSAGDRVRHSIFGKGTVVRMIDSVRVKVLFDVAGEKTLRLDYTSLARI